MAQRVEEVGECVGGLRSGGRGTPSRLLFVSLVLKRRVLRWGISMRRHHTGVVHPGRRRRIDLQHFHAEAPLITVVEQKQELPFARRTREGHLPQRCARGRASAWSAQEASRRLERVFRRTVPCLATQKEGPQVRVAEAKGQRNRRAEVREGLIGGELKLSPHALPAARPSAGEADPERIHGRFWCEARPGHCPSSLTVTTAHSGNASVSIRTRFCVNVPAGCTAHHGTQRPTRGLRTLGGHYVR